jgi:hypothetical protein
LIVEGLHEVRSFLKSDAAHLMLAALTAGRFILHYLNHYRLPEANGLAATVIAAMILAVLMAVSQCEAPRMMIAGIRCNSLQAGNYATEITLRKALRGQPG